MSFHSHILAVTEQANIPQASRACGMLKCKIWEHCPALGTAPEQEAGRGSSTDSEQDMFFNPFVIRDDVMFELMQYIIKKKKYINPQQANQSTTRQKQQEECGVISQQGCLS